MWTIIVIALNFNGGQVIYTLEEFRSEAACRARIIEKSYYDELNGMISAASCIPDRGLERLRKVWKTQ